MINRGVNTRGLPQMENESNTNQQGYTDRNQIGFHDFFMQNEQMQQNNQIITNNTFNQNNVPVNQSKFL